VAPRTQQRPATGAGRFARQQAAGRARTSSAGTGRFTRSTQSRYAGPSNVLSRRTKPPKKQSGPAKVMSSLTGMLSGGAAKKKGSSHGKGKSAGGLAALAGIAGLAIKNRDKLTSLRGGRREPERPVTH
jgi:hypothetical protein